MGVSVCHCILKSHSAESWVFFALRCYLKTKESRHLNKRWEIQLIIRKAVFTMPAPWKHMDQQQYLYLRTCFLFLLPGSISDMTWMWLLFRGAFTLRLVCLQQCDPQLGPQPFHHQKAFCCCFSCFLLMLLILWKTLAFQANYSY